MCSLPLISDGVADDSSFTVRVVVEIFRLLKHRGNCPVEDSWALPALD